MKIILSGEMDINTSARVLSSDYYEIFNLFFANKKYSEDEIKLGILYICRPFKLNRRKSYFCRCWCSSPQLLERKISS